MWSNACEFETVPVAVDGIRIVQANLADATHADGIIACLDAYASDPMGGGKPLSEDIKAALIPGLQQHGANATFLALEGETVVGMALCMIGFSTFRAKTRLNVHDLAVNPPWRGRGIGRLLLQSVIDYAGTIDCSAVSLEVRIDNPRAQALYRSLGFTDCDVPMMFWVKSLTEK